MSVRGKEMQLHGAHHLRLSGGEKERGEVGEREAQLEGSGPLCLQVGEGKEEEKGGERFSPCMHASLPAPARAMHAHPCGW